MIIQEEIVNESRKINMSDLQFNALLGTILADAYIGASGATTARVQWNHSSKQHEYCLHKYETLQKFATIPAPETQPRLRGRMELPLSEGDASVFPAAAALLFPTDGSVSLRSIWN